MVWKSKTCLARLADSSWFAYKQAYQEIGADEIHRKSGYNQLFQHYQHLKNGKPWHGNLQQQ